MRLYSESFPDNAPSPPCFLEACKGGRCSAPDARVFIRVALVKFATLETAPTKIHNTDHFPGRMDRKTVHMDRNQIGSGLKTVRTYRERIGADLETIGMDERNIRMDSKMVG